MKLIILFLSCLLSLNVFAGEAFEIWYKKALAAERKGETLEAMRLFKKSYELGFIGASGNIALIYYHGRGAIPQDHQLAVKWFHKSGGYLMLGNMYSRGQGVLQSDEQAYIWSALNAKYNKEFNNKEYMAKKLTFSQIKEADIEVEKLYKEIQDKRKNQPVSHK